MTTDRMTDAEIKREINRFLKPGPKRPWRRDGAWGAVGGVLGLALSALILL